MSREVQNISVFLSSTNDIKSYREKAKQTIHELNKDPFLKRLYSFEASAWEDDIPPIVGEAPQDTIDKYLEFPQEIDVMVCILWYRIGTPIPTKDNKTGTEYEFIIANESYQKFGKPRLLLYRCVEAYPQDANLSQLDDVNRFFKDKFFSEVNSLDNFGVRLNQDLRNIIYKFSIGQKNTLSKRPLNFRDNRDIPLFQREGYLEWLKNLKTDALIVGQPGIGKTYLLSRFVDEVEGAYFLNSVDHQKIISAIEVTLADFIVVDDAHNHQDILKLLLRLRYETSSNFLIIASCWTGSEPYIRQLLDLTSTNCQTLLPLDQRNIAEIFSMVGIKNPQLLNLLIKQAIGLPGLAMSLADAVLAGGIDDVLNGDKLYDFLLYYLMSNESNVLKASIGFFSLGGRSGLPIEFVAKLLDISLANLVQELSTMASGGLVYTTNDGRNLAVRPRALRAALVKKYFFSDPIRLNITDILDHIDDISDLIDTIVDAKHVGAQISYSFIQHYMNSVYSIETWRNYASLGYEEAIWVLNTRPDLLIPIASILLINAPEQTIKSLLKEAIEDNRPLNANPDHPFRLIDDWVSEANPSTGEGFKRKLVLYEEIKIWLKAEKPTSVALKALEYVFSPYWENHLLGATNEQIIVSSGHYLLNDLKDLPALWDEVLALLGEIEIADWKPLIEVATQWVFNFRPNISLPEDIQNFRNAFAEKIILSLSWLAKAHPGVQHELTAMQKRANLNIDLIYNDEGFEILYPLFDHLDYEESAKENTNHIKHLAKIWATEEPLLILDRLLFYLKEAEVAGVSEGNSLYILGREISIVTTNIYSWLDALASRAFGRGFAQPFLYQIVSEKILGWEDILAKFLVIEELRFEALPVILKLDPIPSTIYPAVVRLLSSDKFAKLLGVISPADITLVQELLLSENIEVINSIVESEWMISPKRSVRKEIYTNWEQAVIEKFDDDFWLSDIFSRLPSLAFKWITFRIQNPNWKLYHYDKAIPAAVSAMSAEEKLQLFSLISPEHYGIGELIALLVEDDLILYEALLNHKALHDLHLVPISYEMNGKWANKIMLAFDYGYTSDEILSASLATITGIFSWSNKRSDFYKEKLHQFNQLLECSDSRVIRVGERAIDILQKQIVVDIKKENYSAIYGEDW